MSEIIITCIVAVLGSNVICTIVTEWFKKKNKDNERDDAVKASCKLLLKTRIRELCEGYISQGWIYADELEDLIAMHSLYHNDLNGNGYLDTLMGKVKALEVRGIR